MSEFSVLDVHHHVGNAFSALGGDVDLAGDAAAEEYDRLELASRLDIMDRGGVAQALVIPGHGYERSRGIDDTRAVNDGIAAYRDRNPDRAGISHILGQILESDLTDEQKTLILGDNARRLFGVQPLPTDDLQ